MKCEQIKYQLIDYIDGTLTAQTKAEVENHIETCDSCQEELINTGKLLKEISNTTNIEPSEKLKTGFYQMLEAEKTTLHEKPLKSSAKTIGFRHLTRTLRIAAQIAILIGIAVIINNQMRNSRVRNIEIASLKQEVNYLQQNMNLVSLKQPSASQRIHAINNMNYSSTENTDIINALINTMNTDENVNVRMTSMYALTKFSDIENVRFALLTSLSKQTDPILQISLINIIVGFQDIRVKESLKNIITNENYSNTVKEQAKNGLETFI